MLHSESVYQLSEKGKIVIGVAISVLGFCFGLLSFGVGLILSRLKKMELKMSVLRRIPISFFKLLCVALASRLGILAIRLDCQ